MNENSRNVLFNKKNVLTEDISNRDILDKSVPISKLRNILTDAIIRQQNMLKKGESVQLTLEIDLLKPQHKIPNTSLVEVTIVEYNSTETKNQRDSINVNGNKLLFKDKINKLSSEILNLQKRRQLKKMVNSQNEVKNVLNKKYKENEIVPKGNKHECEDICLVVSDEKMKTDYSHRMRNFVRVLPKETSSNGGDIEKGYQRVSKNKREQKSASKFQHQRDTKQMFTKDSTLVRKISKVFLPTNNIVSNTVGDTEYTVIKNELNNKNHQIEKTEINSKTKREKKAPSRNTGNLKDNTLIDIVKCPDDDKSYFQSIMSKKRKHKKIPKNKNISVSYSDTCIYCHEGKAANVTKNNFTCDPCPVNQSTESASTTNELQNIIVGDSLLNSKNKNKFKQKPLKHNKNGRGDIKSSHYVNSKPQGHTEQSKSVNNKKSTIYWNGETIEINKLIKKRIEMLIFNELQNLALKEGMECDVTPLPTTDNSLDGVKEISSYVCELDISDSKIKKTIKKLTKNNTKYAKCKSMQESNQIYKTDNIMDSNNINNTNFETFESNFIGLNVCEPLNIAKQEKISSINNNHETTKTLVEYTESREALFKSSTSNSKIDINPVKSYMGYVRKKQSDEKLFRKGFVKKITSNDSTWFNFVSSKISSDRHLECKISKFSTQTREIPNSSVMTSKECDNEIEIELDIQDLELVLRQAKDVHKADKILISTKCKNCKNWQ